MRLVCISDTHAQHDRLIVPDGDVLVCAGDFTRKGSFEDVEAFDRWLGRLPHRYKLAIAGNHDFCFEKQPALARARLTSAIYLEDSGVTLDGVTFWGSPWQPRFFDWAFNLDRGKPLAKKWALIPEQTEVLITHGPPWGILDETDEGTPVGCQDLLQTVRALKPRVHVFGHIHEAYGMKTEGPTTFVNASSCDLRYRPVNPPIVVEL